MSLKKAIINAFTPEGQIKMPVHNEGYVMEKPKE